MKPFTIKCLTCQSKLQVQGQDLLGKIVNCPRCNSMVEIPGELPGSEPGGVPDGSESSRWQPAGEENPPPHFQQGGTETVDDFGYEHDSLAGAGEPGTPSRDVVSFSSQAAQEDPSLDDGGQDHQLPATGAWVSEKTQQRSRQVLLAGMAVALLLVVASIIFYSLSDDSPEPTANVPGELAVNPDVPVDEIQAGQEDPEEPELLEPEEGLEENPEPVIDPPDNVPMPPPDPPPPVDPVTDDPPGLVADESEEDATTDDVAGTLRQFGDALEVGGPPPSATLDEEQEVPDEKGQPERMPIPAGDVEASLAFAIVDLEISQPIPFHHFTEMFSRIGNLPITIDLEALAASDLQLDSPIELVRKETNVGEVLQTVTDAHQLALTAANGHLLISWPEVARTQPVTVDYLVPGGPPGTTHGLPEMLREMVSPESWQGMEGAGTIEMDGDQLKVTQTRQVHSHVGMLLERLNAARARDPADEKRLPRVPAVKAQLSQPISLNFARETPLGTILRRLGQEAGMHIQVDWVATHPVGWSAASPTTLVADRNEFSQVLAVFLDSMKLDYRIVDATTIQVSTSEQLAARHEIELHDISTLIGDKSAADIVMQAQAILGRDTAAGIIVDTPSQRLLVRASQADQVRIHRWIHPQP